jgi:hypothetical protein
METRKLPVGISDFKDVISDNYYYVDKTLFIKEIIDRGDKILLVPRPRRFGKTLNLSMLKYFYDCCPELVFICYFLAFMLYNRHGLCVRRTNR